MFFRSAAILTTLACVVTSFAIPLVNPGDLVNDLSLANTVAERQLDLTAPALLVGTGTDAAQGVPQVRRQDDEDNEDGGAKRRQDDDDDDDVQERRQDDDDEAERRQDEGESDVDRRAPEHLTLPDVFHGACAQLIPIADQLREFA